MRFQTGLIGLMLMAGLTACSSETTTPIPTPIDEPSKTSTVEGTLGTGLETDIELFAKPGLRPQASGEAENVLTGTYVVAVNASGEVLASSSVDAKGKFSLTTNRGQVVALALATKGPSKKWLCQQTLQYQDFTDLRAEAKIAVLNLETPKINAGNFSWKASNGRPTSATGPNSSTSGAVTSSAVTSSAGNPNAFVDESLNGFMRCGNQDAKETIVQADFDLEFSNDLPIDDPARTYTNSFVFGLDTSGPRPRFKGSAHINKNGSFEMRVRHEAGQPVLLAPVITDDRAVAAGITLMPTWNLGLDANDVLQQPQLGRLTGSIVLASGTVEADDGSVVSGARIDWTQADDATLPASQIALGRGISGFASDGGTNDNTAGRFRLLVPKRSKLEAEAYRMNITDPVTLERTNIDVSVTADPSGPFAGFSQGGNTLANGTIKLEKPKARHVVIDVTFIPASNNVDAKLTYMIGSGSQPFQTILPLRFTASQSGPDTVVNMDFSSLETSQKNTDFVLAKVASGLPTATETPTNVGSVNLGTCSINFACTSGGLTENAFARSIQPNPSGIVQVNATQIDQQINNAGTELTGIGAVSRDAFPVVANSFLGISSTSLAIQIRWPTANTVGRNQVKFQLNFLTLAR